MAYDPSKEVVHQKIEVTRKRSDGALEVLSASIKSYSTVGAMCIAPARVLTSNGKTRAYGLGWVDAACARALSTLFAEAATALDALEASRASGTPLKTQKTGGSKRPKRADRGPGALATIGTLKKEP